MHKHKQEGRSRLAMLRPKCTDIIRWAQDILNGNLISFYVGC